MAAMERLLPPTAHTLAARIEDQLREWNARDPARPRFETRRANERACRLLGDLIVVLQKFRDELTRELGEYDDARRRLARG
jgi:hypothetical protein